MLQNFSRYLRSLKNNNKRKALVFGRNLSIEAYVKEVKTMLGPAMFNILYPSLSENLDFNQIDYPRNS